MPKTSVVIPSFNGQEYLQKNLPVVMQLGADEIIVVDDASADGSREVIRKFKEIKLVENKQNLRFPRSVNKGFDHAAGEIVFLLNQDVKPNKNLIKQVLPHFADPQVFAVTFAEKNRSWAKVKLVRGFLEFENGERDNKVHESFWASGGSAAFRHDLWDKLGGFDPIFTPGYFEDMDLGWRAHRAGYSIIWDPKCTVDHETETSFNKAFEPVDLRRIKERNYLLAHWKNLQGKQLLEHGVYLLVRLIKSPGYVIPVVLALWRKLAS